MLSRVLNTAKAPIPTKSLLCSAVCFHRCRRFILSAEEPMARMSGPACSRCRSLPLRPARVDGVGKTLVADFDPDLNFTTRPVRKQRLLTHPRVRGACISRLVGADYF